LNIYNSFASLYRCPEVSTGYKPRHGILVGHTWTVDQICKSEDRQWQPGRISQGDIIHRGHSK